VRLASRYSRSFSHLNTWNLPIAISTHTEHDELKGDSVKQFKNELIDSAIIRRSSYDGIDGNPFTDLILTK